MTLTYLESVTGRSMERIDCKGGREHIPVSYNPKSTKKVKTSIIMFVCKSWRNRKWKKWKFWAVSIFNLSRVFLHSFAEIGHKLDQLRHVALCDRIVQGHPDTANRSVSFQLDHASPLGFNEKPLLQGFVTILDAKRDVHSAGEGPIDGTAGRRREGGITGENELHAIGRSPTCRTLLIGQCNCRSDRSCVGSLQPSPQPRPVFRSIPTRAPLCKCCGGDGRS